MDSRGHDVKFIGTKDGAAFIGLRGVEGVTVDLGMTAVTRTYVGESSTRTHGVNGVVTLTQRSIMRSTEAASIIEAQRLANMPNAERRAVDFGFTLSIDHGSDGRTRWSFPACTLSNPRVTVQGKDDLVMFDATWLCDNPERI
jgi:hypothetical protein